MANRTVTVKSSGGDYTSLNAAFAGEDDTYSDLPTNTMILTFECHNFEDTTQCNTGTSWTVNTSYYLNVVAADDHGGKFSTSAYRLVVTDGNPVFTLQESCARFVGIQMKLTGATANGRAVFLAQSIVSGGDVRFEQCILDQGSSASYYARGFNYNDPDLVIRMKNCVVCGPPTASSLLNNAITGACTIHCHNSTFIGGKGGRIVRFSAGTCNFKNCYSGADSAGAAYYFDISGNLTTCASSDSTGNEGLRTIAINTTNFTNVTAGSEDYHLPSGSALVGAGTNLYNDANYAFQDDIDGQDRGGSGATWDIGADEYVSAAAIIVPFLWQYRNRRI